VYNNPEQMQTGIDGAKEADGMIPAGSVHLKQYGMI